MTRLPDVKLFGQTFRVFLPRDIGPASLDAIQDMAEFRRVLERTSDPDVSIPWARALTGMRGREVDFRFWVFFFRTSWNFDQYDEETIVDPRGAAPRKFFDYVTRRSRSHGWFFLPREGYEVEITTLQDFDTGRLFTEATLVIEDRATRPREGLLYRRTARRFLSRQLLQPFPVEPEGVTDPVTGTVEIAGLPDLDRPPERREDVSFVLRLVLGPRFHGGDVGEGEAWDPADRAHRLTHARAVHDRIHDALFHRLPSIDRLFAAMGTQDSFASFRIVVKPARKADRATVPIRVYRGQTGDLRRDVSGYPSLRRLYESAGTVF